MNLQAVDNTLDNLFEVQVPTQVTSQIHQQAPIPDTAPEFVRQVLGKMVKERRKKVAST